MKLFKDNLREYETVMNLSSADIAELADLPLHVIESMEKGKSDLHAVRTLCTKLCLDFSSIYADTGLKSISTEAQYDKYPNDLKLAVTKAFFSAIRKALGEEKWKTVVPFHCTLKGRFLAGSAVMDLGHLSKLKSALKDELPSDAIIDLLANTMYTKIPNHNLVMAKEAFGLTYQDIAQELGLHRSTVASWGGTNCFPIPDQYILILCDKLGGFHINKFRTVLLKLEDFEGRTTSILPASTISANEVEELDFVDPPEDEVAELAVVESSVVEGVGASEVKIEMTTDRIRKMYAALPDSAKQRVNQLITELFLDTM